MTARILPAGERAAVTAVLMIAGRGVLTPATSCWCSGMTRHEMSDALITPFLPAAKGEATLRARTKDPALRLQSLRPILAGMTRHPTTPPIRWDIYKLAPKQTWIGEVEASDEREMIEIAARLPLSKFDDSAAVVIVSVDRTGHKLAMRPPSTGRLTYARNVP